MENQQPQKSGSNKVMHIVYIIIIILLLGGMGFFINKSLHPEKSKEFITLDNEKNTLESDYMQKVEELNIKEQELEQLKGDNAEANRIIEERQAEIQALKADLEKAIKSKNYSAGELQKAKSKIADLEASNARFVKTIDSLYGENRTLTAEKEQLSTDLQSEKETTQTLTKEKNYLQGKFEIGSLLQTNNLTAIGVKGKGSGKEVETNRIKKMDKLRITFETGDNKVIESGVVNLYLRVLNPKGEPLYNEAQGSGTLKNAEDGQTIKYTKKIELTYNNSNKKISVYWSQGVYQEGFYTAEIYQDPGYKIGFKRFELKGGM